MNNKLLVTFVIALSFTALSQTELSVCGTSTNYDIMDCSQRGGKYLTASGDLKVLVIFAKFKDDNSPHQYWPADSYPEEMNNFIDSDMQTGSTHYLNLTNYYNQMSFGNFRVTGKVIGAETPYPMSHYLLGSLNYPNRVAANTDILELVDNYIDYREFDNWTYISDFNHINKPDGIVDMIVIIWRGLVFTDQWSGEASLGQGPEFFVENNQEKIKMHYGGYPGFSIYGSGVTVQYWANKTRERNFKVVIHEIAHWLINAEHPYNNSNLIFWGMLTLGSEGICANSFEREKLAWINPTIIDGTILSAPMGDFITTPSAYKFHPPNGFTGEMYYFENHQQISIYDDVTRNPDDKGIFILHLANGFYAGDCMRVLTSNGFWNWDIPVRTDCWGNDLPVFRKTSVNRNGFGNRDRIVSCDSTCGFLYSYFNDNNEAECNDWLHGYGLINSFTPESNDIFSTWSNPPAKTFAGQPVDFLMEVVNQSGSIVTARFVTQNAVGCKPSKPPLGFNPDKIENQNQSNSIYIVWGSDKWDGMQIEPDINWAELQMRINSSEWITVYSGANRYWTDSNYVYDKSGELLIDFRVKVSDSQNKFSMWSDILTIDKKFNNLTSADYMDSKRNIEPDEFMLNQNYPNPFNPVTKISFTIPTSPLNPSPYQGEGPGERFVTLKVYDLLGNEIVTLVSEEKMTGSYEIEFNASKLASGTYFYQLKSGEFIETKKMLLVK
jgi:M6 family metalloprotease-like protein